MSKKELLKRIKSLEEYLGLAFIKPENKDDYADHIPSASYGRAAKLEKLIGNTKN
ncbi:MAG TPA: hypothetical protein VGJ00_07830 [Rhabdochlamydiaceae bacterium]|jgi:hypothetical protein